jgi:hypothetical protein
MQSAAVTVIVAIGLAGIYWFAFGEERHELQRRRHQVTDINLACHLYAEHHEGVFPGELRQLSEIYGENSPFLARAVAELELVSPAAHVSNDSDKVLIRERSADTKGRRMCGYIDGRFEAHDADGRSFLVPEPGVL